MYPGLWKRYILQALLEGDVGNFFAPGNSISLLLDDIAFEFLCVGFPLIYVHCGHHQI